MNLEMKALKSHARFCEQGQHIVYVSLKVFLLTLNVFLSGFKNLAFVKQSRKPSSEWVWALQVLA